jgi:hypothetical protein
MRVARLAGVLGCLALAACSSAGPGGPDAATRSAAGPAPCRTDVLAGWRAGGLAVLWVGPPNTGPTGKVSVPSAVAAMDVRNGEIRSYCPLPAPATAPAGQQGYSLPMRQGGTGYPPYLADIDLMLRTQWLSPDFRWFGGPGLPLVDVAAGRTVVTDWTGTLAGVGRAAALIRDGAGPAGRWCTAALPPTPGQPCTPLTAPAGPGGFVIGTTGSPVWVPAEARRLPFGPVTGYAVTDGARIYRADTEPAATRRANGPAGPLHASVDLDPAGLGGFQTFIDDQPVLDLAGWFSVESIGSGGIRTRYHHTTAAPKRLTEDFSWLVGEVSDVSRAVVDGGTVAVSAALRVQDREPGTRFGALVDGTDKVVDLTAERGLRCPVAGAFCRIIAWPDGSLRPSA